MAAAMQRCSAERCVARTTASAAPCRTRARLESCCQIAAGCQASPRRWHPCCAWCRSRRTASGWWSNRMSPAWPAHSNALATPTAPTPKLRCRLVSCMEPAHRIAEPSNPCITHAQPFPAAWRRSLRRSPRLRSCYKRARRTGRRTRRARSGCGGSFRRCDGAPAAAHAGLSALWPPTAAQRLC